MSEHEEGAEMFVEQVHPDFVLETLAAVIEKSGMDGRTRDRNTISLTVLTPSGVVSGMVISRAEWVETTREIVESGTTGENTTDALVHLLTATTPPISDEQPVNYLHFESATVWSGPQMIRMRALRVVLDDVTGWSFGVHS